jgi:hypothetical protein
MLRPAYTPHACVIAYCKICHKSTLLVDVSIHETNVTGKCTKCDRNMMGYKRKVGTYYIYVFDLTQYNRENNTTLSKFGLTNDIDVRQSQHENDYGTINLKFKLEGLTKREAYAIEAKIKQQLLDLDSSPVIIIRGTPRIELSNCDFNETSISALECAIDYIGKCNDE